MGENNIPRNVIIEIDDGEKIQIENCKIVCLTNEADINEYDSFDERNFHAIKNNYELSIKIKPIRRKRFIKLLMSIGLQKTEAIALANYSFRKYRYYNQELFLLL